MRLKLADLAIYAAHAGFWLVFITATTIRKKEGSKSDNPAAAERKTATHSRLLLGLHMGAFGVLYSGIGLAVFNGGVPGWFSGQRIVGACLIALGAVLAAWAVLYFRSWRFRAEVTAGHQLATGGPFFVLRHPIYAGLNLLALGSAVWIPSPILWIALGLMLIGSDLRGRAEEKLLIQTFGSAYSTYMKKTWRFIPGVY